MSTALVLYTPPARRVTLKAVAWFLAYCAGWLVLALTLASVVGCGGTVFRVDERFTEEERNTLADSLLSWQDAGAAKDVFLLFGQKVDVTDRHCTIVRTGERAAENAVGVLRDADTNAALTDDTINGVRIVFVMDRIYRPGNGIEGTTASFRGTALHEFGHYFTSQGHLDNPDDVMYHASVAVALTANDVRAITRLER